MTHLNESHDPLRPHQHEPNPEPPTPDPTFEFSGPGGINRQISVDLLERLPQTSVPNCYIVSTGHGTSGPFTFGGVTLLAFVQSQLPANTPWSQVEVVSADGFGNRVLATELQQQTSRPILLAYTLDGQKLSRRQGLVRLIVPSETDDALRQVKWVGQVTVRAQASD